MVTFEKLKFVQQNVVDDLHSRIAENIDRYQSGNFMDLAQKQGWSIESKHVTYDPDFAGKLQSGNSPEEEIDNSLLVYESLQGITPALAREERLWVRLCHLDCLNYSRERWIKKTKPENDVKNHFFANRLDQTRDDNALGRLWWNAYLASIIDPDNPKRVLKQILKKANIRMQFVDRANASFRLPLARGIVRLLERESWLDSHDRAFEVFMLVLDLNAGGMVFEALADVAVDDFLKANLPLAKKEFARRIGSA